MQRQIAKQPKGAAGGGNKKSLGSRIMKNKIFYLFLLPAVLVITIFKYYPFLTSV